MSSVLVTEELCVAQEMMLNELVRRTSATSPCGGASVSDGQMKCANGVVTQQQQPEGALAMIQTMQSMYSSINPGVDSFVNPCNGSNVVESHARQNSTDSGLGMILTIIRWNVTATISRNFVVEYIYWDLKYQCDNIENIIEQKTVYKRHKYNDIQLLITNTESV